MRRRCGSLAATVLLVAAACSPRHAPPWPAPQTPGVPEDRAGLPGAGDAMGAGAERPAQAFTSALADLEQAVRARVAEEPGDYGIAVVDVETGRSFGVNDRLVLHAASTMKVPVLLELYRRTAEGEIELDGRVRVRNRFRSIADGSAYSLSPEDDSERELYELVGGTTTWRDLARRMIVRSSNLATNLLIDTLGAGAIQTTTDRSGAGGMRVLRGVEDIPAYRAGMNNTTTARALAGLLASVARCDILSRAECEEVLDILAAQEFNEMIPAGLPEGTRVAHKTGWITGIQHDGAIVLPEASPPFVIVVLSRDAADTLAPQRVAADVARLSWEALGPGGTLRPRWPTATAELLALHDRYRVPAFPAPRLGYDELWSALRPIVDGGAALRRDEIGRSAAGRPLYLVRAGEGETRVLLWSQMHGDETTASRALTDLFNYIASAGSDPRVRRWTERLTILAVPMLNPDGADAHRRRNDLGIDVNRDARMLATPEARALKSVQERWQPDFGFNLHDQNPRSRTGSADRIAAIALLAPAPDADASPTPSFVRAQQLTAHLAHELAPLVGRHLTRYEDTYNARAFGDGMQNWGVSTVLIESGGWGTDESKHYLRKVNFVALATALDAIAGGDFTTTDRNLYLSLPRNGRAVNDLLIRGGQVVLPGRPPFRADLAINARAVGGPERTQIVDIGDLRENAARDTVDATGLFIHPAADDGSATAELQPGSSPAALHIRRGADASSERVASVQGVRVRWFERN